MKRALATAAGPRWLGLAASVLALASCYATLAMATALSALGIAVGLDEAIRAAAIALFAVVAVGAVALGRRRHGCAPPAALAAAGAALILWTMFGGYNPELELAGFVTLKAAAVWDWRLGRARAGSGRRREQRRIKRHRNRPRPRCSADTGTSCASRSSRRRTGA